MKTSKIKDIIFFSRIGISFILALLGRFVITEETCSVFTCLFVNLMAYFIISYDVYLELFEGFKDKEFVSEELLMVIASLGAFSLRFFGKEYTEYFEGVLIILLYQVGEYFQDLAEQQSRDAITETIELKNEEICVMTNGQLIKKTPQDIEVNDICVFGNGNKILCDGIVIDGKCEVDESSISGESILVCKTVNSKVYSGSIVVSGSIKVKATCKYSDSTVGKLISYIKESVSSKSKFGSFADKFASIYSPIILCLSFIIGVIIPTIINFKDLNIWQHYLYLGLKLLVIGCPCSIVISIPLTCFASIGLASKQGIMVKGSQYIEEFRNINIFCFDKTGTITTSELVVNKVVHSKEIEEENLLEYCLAAESRSNHPIARALRNYSKIAINHEEITNYEEITGNGISLTYKGQKIKVGKLSFMDYKIDENLNDLVIFVQINDLYAGYVSFSEHIRPDSIDTINNLKANSIGLYVLSGDSSKNVDKIAYHLGIKGYGDLKPLDKSSMIDSLIKQGNMVAFIGDGINDAPSIVRADIGIAMGSRGSDIAIENADIVLINDKLTSIYTLYRISNSTYCRNLFNVLFTLLVKIVILLLSILIPSFPLWIAVFADTGLTLFLVLFALSLLRKTY